MAHPPAHPSGRLAWIDHARGYGMILVFYGHSINPLVGDDAGVFSQFKLIYAFHMPLFFVLAGYVSRRPDGPWYDFVLSKLRTRIVPALFFCLLAVLAAMVRRELLDFRSPWPSYARWTPMFYGLPFFNHMTWFLYCLFSAELLHFGLHRTEGSPRREALVIPFLFGVGWVIAWLHRPLMDWLSWPGFPFFGTEAVIAYAFLRTGRLWRRLEWAHPKSSLWIGGAILIVLGLALWLTYGLNHGPFSWFRQAVIMAAMSHGNPLLFVSTALLGTAFIFQLSALTPATKPLLFIGRSSLILLGLNGIFFHYINKPVVARWLGEAMLHAPWATVLVGLAYSLASIAVCVPLILLFERYLPFLVGRRGSRRPPSERGAVD